MWKIKQFFRKNSTLIIALVVLFAGYKAYKTGYLRKIIPRPVAQVIYHIPVIGPKFRQYQQGGSYAYGKRYKRGHYRKRSRRHR